LGDVQRVIAPLEPRGLLCGEAECVEGAAHLSARVADGLAGFDDKHPGETLGLGLEALRDVIQGAGAPPAGDGGACLAGGIRGCDGGLDL
jgi:hypothetical protein